MKILKQLLFLVISLQPLAAVAGDTSLLAELLVFHASQETSSTWASTISGSGKTLDFDATNVNFKWKNGFRGGLLHEFDCTNWDTGVYWTYVPAKAKSGFSIGNQIVIPEYFSGFLSGNFFFGAKQDWKLTMNMVDLAMGRKIDIDESFIIRPNIGVKGGTIHQTVNCEWDAGIYTAHERLKNNFSGAGPSFGIDTKWNMCNNFSLFGDFSTAIMWGKWKVSDTYSRPSAFFGLVTPTTITTTLDSSKFGTLMYKYRLGVEWAYQQFHLQLGYEMQIWPNQLRLPTFQQLPLHGGLTLQGGACRIIIDF